MCFSKKNAWIFFISLPLSFSPVTTGAGAGDRRALPGARARHGSGGGGGGGGGDGSVICSSIKKIMICDLWNLDAGGKRRVEAVRS